MSAPDVREAARLLKPGGRFGILHFLVPMVRRPLRLVRVYGITTGCGYAIRAWSIFEKDGGALLPADEVDRPATGKEAT